MLSCQMTVASLLVYICFAKRRETCELGKEVKKLIAMSAKNERSITYDMVD